jgi:hypothetical protein
MAFSMVFGMVSAGLDRSPTSASSRIQVHTIRLRRFSKEEFDALASEPERGAPSQG